mgnify:CR=1 FL=1
MVTLIDGFVGGVVATVAMTALMMTMGDDSPPPTALFLAKYVGDGDPTAYKKPGLLLHLGYGIAGGAVFVLAAPAVGFGLATTGTAVLAGLAYGFVLFLVAAMFWMNVVLGMDADLKMATLFLLFHLVYGGVLGAVAGAGLFG